MSVATTTDSVNYDHLVSTKREGAGVAPSSRQMLPDRNIPASLLFLFFVFAPMDAKVRNEVVLVFV